MSNTEWKEYYDRWSNRISSIENRPYLISEVIYKYGTIQEIARVMIFDCLYEYAKRFGTKIECDNCELSDILVDEYDVDGFRMQMFYSTPPGVIRIIKL